MPLIKLEAPEERSKMLACILLLVLLVLLAAGISAQPCSESDWRADGAGFEDVEDPALGVFALPEPWRELQGLGDNPAELLGRVLTLSHDVPIAEGETLRIHEFFTLRSWLRQPKRAVLFLTTTSITADLWNIPVEGYNGPEMLARRGFFAFTADYIGAGDNYRPGMDALDSTFERNLEALKAVVRYIRYFRAVTRVDLVGESWGGAHATQLGADPCRIRSCVMSSMTYKQVANPRFVSPEFVSYLKTLENNYLPANPALVDKITADAPEAVKVYVRESQTGLRLTTQLWQIIGGLPHFDPSVARIPGLVISGATEAADGRALASDYGVGGAQFFEIPGAGHSPRLGSPEIASAFWDRVLLFIDPKSSGP